jgi:hypothetical protein
LSDTHVFAIQRSDNGEGRDVKACARDELLILISVSREGIVKGWKTLPVSLQRVPKIP